MYDIYVPMEARTDTNDAILALTNENQRLVNFNLLNKVKNNELGGMKALFDKLDASLKGEGLLKYDGMKRAVERNIKDLSNLAGNPDELDEWLRNRKKSSSLQIRITPALFLLNNILVLLGISFEDLFNKNTLPGIAEKNAADIETIKDEMDSKETCLLLREMNSKLDEIKDKYIGKRIRKRYMDRYNDLIEYLFFI